MFSLLIAASMLYQPVDAPLTNYSESDINKLLISSGYTIKKAERGSYDEYTRKNYPGVRHVSYRELGSSNSTLKRGSITDIEIVTNYVASKNLDVIPPYPLASASNEHIQTILLQHLDNSILATSHIQNVQNRTSKELVDALDFVWDGTQQHAKQLDSRFVQVYRWIADLDSSVDNRWFAYSDEKSLEALVKYWGWGKNMSWPVSSNGWAFSASLGSYTGWFREIGSAWKTDGNRFEVHINLEKIEPAKLKWLSANVSRYPWAKLYQSPSDQVVTCVGIIKLDRLTTVANVKRQIETFVDHVKDLDKDMKN